MGLRNKKEIQPRGNDKLSRKLIEASCQNQRNHKTISIYKLTGTF